MAGNREKCKMCEMNLKIHKYKLLLLFSLLLSCNSYAQAPESMNYQAVIRDGSGDLVTSQQVGLRIKILQGSASGSSVYEETYSPTTNAYGLVNLQLGTGTVQSGTFSSIDWGNGPYFVETAADVSGGTSYVTLSTTQFMSVPYALYAKNAGLDSAAVQAMIDAAGGNGGSSGGKSFAFPEGLHGTPITYAISSGNYTVPTGKRLYILNLQGGTSHTLNVNGFAINYYATNNTTDKTLGLPIILSAGDVLSGTDAVFNGFLVNSNANLTTVTHRLLGNSNYTVPAGKILYILNVNGGTLHNLYIDGTRVNNYLTNSTSNKTLNLPIIASTGNVITGADGVFNGYVVDEDFFESSSSGSGSSGGGLSTTNDFMWTNSTTIINESGTAYWSGNPPGNQQSWTVPSGYIWKIIRYSGSTGSLTADENGEFWLNESQSLTFKGNGSNGGTLPFSFMAWQYLKSELDFNVLNYSGTGYWNNNPPGNQVSWTVPTGKLWKIKYTTGACQTSFGSGEKWLDEGQTISFTGNGSNGSSLAFSFMAFEYDK